MHLVAVVLAMFYILPGQATHQKFIAYKQFSFAPKDINATAMMVRSTIIAWSGRDASGIVI